MNTKQKLVGMAGVVLLALVFLFPFSSYPTKEILDDGVTHRSTTRSGFVPIWRVKQANAQATLKGNIFDDVVIIWPAVLGLAAALVGGTGVMLYQMSNRGAQSSSESRPVVGLTKARLLNSLMHGVIAAVIYLGVKHLARGLVERDLWMALAIAAVIALVQAWHWNRSKHEVQKTGEP